MNYYGSKLTLTIDALDEFIYLTEMLNKRQ